MGSKEEVRATEEGEVEEKTTYELLRDARVAELADSFKPVQMALEAL
jgi:hypothetical protein